MHAVDKTGLESFLHQSGQVCLSSVCLLSFYFLHDEEIFSFWVNRERKNFFMERKFMDSAEVALKFVGLWLSY